METLTTRFGARPAGSPAEAAAAEWGAQLLREKGFSDVRVERFPLQIWREGESSVTILGKPGQRLVAVALGGSNPGPPVTAPAVVFQTYEDFVDADPARVRGRIVVVIETMERDSEGAGYRELAPARYAGPELAKSRGAAGFLIRSLATHEHRVTSSGATRASPEPFPAFAISPPDAEQLGRLAKLGPVRLHLASAAGWAGTGQSQNVVATVPGTDPSAEPILISAHLDSWGQGTGAIDDGFGLAVVTSAAERLLSAKVRPRRTIHLVWFGAEEVSQPGPEPDFPGAVAYVHRHRNELANIAIAAECDWGDGRITRLSLPVPAGDPILAEVETALAPFGVPVIAEVPQAPGPDVGVLVRAGVPTFRLHQDATHLFDRHHTPNDTLEAMDRDALEQNVEVWTRLLEVLANRTTNFLAATLRP